MAKRGRPRTGYMLAKHYRIAQLKRNIKVLWGRGCELKAKQCEKELAKLQAEGR